MREAYITSHNCLSKSSLHEYLRKQLDLPGYYGGNLSALADCLSEASKPVLITVAIDPGTLPPGMQAYVLRFAQVCAREALANEHVSLIIEHPSR